MNYKNLKDSKVIAVIGQGSDCTPEISQLAEDVGYFIARKGGVLICGGLYGVMEAACRGAKKGDGLTIGILPSTEKEDANPYVDIRIATGISVARNVIIIRSADAVIAVGGFYGTLSEIAYSLAFEKPLIGLQTWKINDKIHHVKTAKEAVELAFRLID